MVEAPSSQPRRLGIDARNGQRQALVLFGPPGSGKGTQAKMVRQEYGIPHISTGDMLREHIAAGDQVGREVETLMREGRLVPDELVNALLEERIQRPDCEHGFIVDGYPRTVPQAKILEPMLAAHGLGYLIVHLKVDYNRVVARMSGRRVCPVCGSLYSLSSHPPRQADVCDREGAALITREDDRPEVIRERLEAYETLTWPVLEYFEIHGHHVFGISGDGEPVTVFEKIRSVLDS